MYQCIRNNNYDGKGFLMYSVFLSLVILALGVRFAVPYDTNAIVLVTHDCLEKTVVGRSCKYFFCGWGSSLKHIYTGPID